jgi:hypothetical protein
LFNNENGGETAISQIGGPSTDSVAAAASAHKRPKKLNEINHLRLMAWCGQEDSKN